MDHLHIVVFTKYAMKNTLKLLDLLEKKHTVNEIYLINNLTLYLIINLRFLSLLIIDEIVRTYFTG